MTILSMTATFGCLDGRTLTLHEGLNTFVLPNESGKSTWAAFLAAMFYGLDQRRGSRSHIPDKERYAPWSGKPMEGLLELEHEGRVLVLQRTSARGKPFGVFRAWDKQTGLDVPELTADTCGLTLLGVEREVFIRTAFLRGTELAVTRDSTLSARLANLASAGSVSDSAMEADGRLRTWQNHLRYHNSGQIPQLLRRQEASAAAENLPDRDTLLRLLGQLEELPTIPTPPALQGLSCDAMVTKAQKDCRRHSLWLFLYLFGALACGAAACFDLRFAAGGAVFALLFLWLLFSRRLAKGYGVRRKAHIPQAALACRDLALRRMAQQEAMAQICRFSPGTQTVEDARAAVEHALSQLRRPTAEPEALQPLLDREQAILLARQALAHADRALQEDYLPRLTRQTAQLLSELTLGRYDGVIVEPDALCLREAATGFARPAALLSQGTRDELWLALRLAMTQLLLPKDAPLILDDALLTFDDRRRAAAGEVLRQSGRQVLVFQCSEAAF